MNEISLNNLSLNKIIPTSQETKILNIIKDYKVILQEHINDQNNTKFINKHISKIYVINLKKDVLRYNYIKTLFEKYKMNYTFVIVDKPLIETYKTLIGIFCASRFTINDAGCLLSHLWCLNNIIINKFDSTLIFEDDVIFHKNFEELFINIINKNVKYDYLKLGAADFNFTEKNANNVENGLYRPTKNAHKNFGTHSILYSIKGAEFVFNWRIQHLAFFDYKLLKVFEYFPDTAFVCYPNLVCAELSTSNLNHDYYNKMETDYYKQCFDNFSHTEYNFIYLDILSFMRLVKQENNDTYETYIDKLLETYLIEKGVTRERIILLKSRLVLDFFTLNDLKNIANITA
jgi:GR25 family glycosyltransferase involved in LPS biosynthesis